MTDFKSPLGIGGCFVEQVGELLQTMDEKFYDEASGKVIIQGEDAIELLKALWGATEGSFTECLNKEIVIELGDSPTANFAETMLKFVLTTLLGVNPSSVKPVKQVPQRQRLIKTKVD